MQKALLLLLLLVSGNQHLLAQENNDIQTLERKLLEHTKKDSVRIKILLDLGYECLQKEPQKTVVYIEEAIMTAREFQNSEWLAQTLTKASNRYTDLSQYTEAMNGLYESLAVCESNKLHFWKVITLKSIGVVFSHLGINDKAVQYTLDAKNTAIKYNIQRLIPGINTNLGAFYYQNNLPLKSIETLNECIEPLRNSKDWGALIQTLLNIGVFHTEMHQPSLAKIAFDSCQQIIDRHNLGSVYKAQLTINMGAMYLDEFKQPNKSIALLEPILNDNKYTLQPYDALLMNEILARSHFAINSLEKTKLHALASTRIAQDVGIINLAMVSNFELLSKTARAENDWKSALMYTDEAIKWKDSIESDNKKNLAAYELIAHEIESNEKELTEKNNTLKTKQRIYEIAAIVMIPIVLLLFAVLNYRSKLSRSKVQIQDQISYAQKLEKEVANRTKELEIAHINIQESKERENVSLALLNQKHIELLNNLSSKINKWQDSDNSITSKEYQSALNDIKAASAQAEDWGNFMLHFERIHPSFNSKLKELCPALTLNEIKHCALMKFGFSRKQVAENLSTTEEAVKKARNRIRIKLGLDADGSLQELVNSL